jgi:hypothetical protein
MCKFIVALGQNHFAAKCRLIYALGFFLNCVEFLKLNTQMENVFLMFLIQNNEHSVSPQFIQMCEI